jgi:hypothetical protein
MIFGEDEAVKLLKKKLKTAGCDMDNVKKWSRQLQAVKKQSQVTQKQYLASLENLETVENYMKELQELLTGSKSWDKEQLKELQFVNRELKKMRTSCDHEFVVSREDREFHLIYDTICRMIGGFDGADNERILLLSEVENLRALIKEKLEREKPEPIALAFFYLDHKDAELVNLPPERRLEKINEVYETEFLQSIRGQTASAGMSEDELVQVIHEVVGTE